MGAALCRRGDAALCRCSQSPPGSQRTGEPISPDCFHELRRSRSLRSMRSRYELPGTAVSSGRLPSPTLPPDTSTHAKRPRTMAVTHRYKKWTMGNRNGSKEARRYSPGLLYCYRFSITTPPALPESVKSLIFKYRTKREKDNNNLLAR